jgi:hypothetical protein
MTTVFLFHASVHTMLAPWSQDSIRRGTNVAQLEGIVRRIEWLHDRYVERDWKIMPICNNGIDSTLQRFDLLLDGDDGPELGCR